MSIYYNSKTRTHFFAKSSERSKLKNCYLIEKREVITEEDKIKLVCDTVRLNVKTN